MYFLNLNEFTYYYVYFDIKENRLNNEAYDFERLIIFIKNEITKKNMSTSFIMMVYTSQNILSAKWKTIHLPLFFPWLFDFFSNNEAYEFELLKSEDKINHIIENNKNKIFIMMMCWWQTSI